MNARSVLLPLLLAAALGGCRGDTAPAHANAAETGPADSAAAQPAVVDSILPPEEALRRFREGLPTADRLAGGADSRDALVRRFIGAVEAQDTAALREMVVTRAEFAHLVYPTSRYTRPPMQQDPALVWLQMQLNSEKGVVRLLRRHGGAETEFRGYACEEQPTTEGENRLWERCTVQLAADGGDVTLRWFGSIIERDGHFKLMSYANGL